MLILREGKRKAIKEASKPDILLLQDNELPLLYSRTNFQNKLEVQRFNILILGYCLGWRPNSMEKMCPNMFKVEKLPDGRPVVHIHAGSMKNLQNTIDKADTQIFKQSMVTGEDPRFCPVAAFKRQLSILQVNIDDAGPLFQGCSSNGVKFTGKAATYATYRGAADWVSQVVKRPLTFRQCSRNVVFTKLANDAATSVEDKAKFMGVTPKTVSVYHKTSSAKRFACSEVVCKVHIDDVKVEENLHTTDAVKTETDDDGLADVMEFIKKENDATLRRVAHGKTVVRPKPQNAEEAQKARDVAKRAKKYMDKYLDDIFGPTKQEPSESSMRVHPPTPVMPEPWDVIEVEEWEYDECPLTQASERRLDFGERLDYEKMKFRKSVNFY